MILSPNINMTFEDSDDTKTYKIDRVSTNVQFYLRFSVILAEFRQIVLRLHQNARMFMQVATYTQRSQRVQHMHCISAEQYVWTYSMLMGIENVT